MQIAALKSELKRVPLARPLFHGARRLRSVLSRASREQRNELVALNQALGGPIADPAIGRMRERVFLIYGAFNVAGVVGMLPVLAAAWRDGYRLVVLLAAAEPVLVDAYRLCGIDEFVFIEDYDRGATHPRTSEIRDAITSTDALKDFTYNGCRTGKFCLSTLMRWSRLGDPDLADPDTDALLRRQLDASLRAADSAAAIVARYRPAIGFFNERGYSPFGEFFDTILNQGGECITWNAAHRNDMLILKRYRRDNVDQNHFALSNESWAQIKAMPWSDAHWARVHDEIAGSYRSGEWFSECATQVDKSDIERESLMRRLGLDPARKTVCIFPHMFWDATFFWGVDLFQNYEDWFCEVLKVARDNPSLNWIIKIHPANVAKAIRDGYHGEHSELIAVRRVLGELPEHIKVIPPESDISTLSLLDVIDFCLTVRGTIGIEAACFGIRVLTAGTGRYDRRGFTLDFDRAGDYLDALRRLPDVAPMTKEEIESARRFAYGTFMIRPTALRAVQFGFKNDVRAGARSRVVVDAKSMANSPDVVAVAQWIASGKEDFLASDGCGGDLPVYVDKPLLAEVLREPPEHVAGGVRIGGVSVPLRDGVLRFREDSGYNASFALQWNRFKTNQIDAVNGTQLSKKRFAETGWRAEDLQSRKVLEAGCGAGRFTRILAETDARLVSFDYSAAVDACRQNNGHFPNLTLIQCDIFEMPFRAGAFDYVFCHGVIQHTPDPKGAFMALARLVAPGGRLSIDVYRKDGLIRPWKSKYIWRPLSTRMKPETLLRFLEWFIPKWLPIDTAIKRIPYLGNYLGSVIPCWNYYLTDLSPEQKVAWAIMDTFDALAPAYDIPARLEDVQAWFAELGWSDVEVRPGGNGVVGNGRRPG